MAKFSFALTLALIVTPVVAFGHAPSNTSNVRAAHRDTVLKACAAQFGNPVDPVRHLFEVNRFYVLEVKLDKRGRLAQMGVLPKHWFGDSHPEWNETSDVGELTESEYTSLLTRLEKIRPKGQLVKRAKWPVVSATTTRRRDTYKSAILVTDDVIDATRGANALRGSKSFIVYFTAPK
jgi:hypothetical protein